MSLVDSFLSGNLTEAKKLIDERRVVASKRSTSATTPTAGGKTGCFQEGCSTCVGTSSNNQYITSTISFIKIPQTGDGVFLSALSGFN